MITRELYNDARMLMSRALHKYFGERLLPTEMAEVLERAIERAYAAGRESNKAPFDDEITKEYPAPSSSGIRKVRG